MILRVSAKGLMSKGDTIPIPTCWLLLANFKFGEVMFYFHITIYIL